LVHNLDNQPTLVGVGVHLDKLESILSNLLAGAEQMDAAATNAAAEIYLIHIEGQKPAAKRAFDDVLSLEKGRRYVTRLVNWCISDIDTRYEMLVQAAKLQIIATLEILMEDWGEAKLRATHDQVVNQIDRLSRGEGTKALYDEWQKRMTRKGKDRKTLESEQAAKWRQQQEREAADKLGMTIPEYKAHIAECKERERLADMQRRLGELASTCTRVAITGRPDWLQDGAVYLAHGDQLFRLSADDGERVLAAII
jgi:hypothetical protein